MLKNKNPLLVLMCLIMFVGGTAGIILGVTNITGLKENPDILIKDVNQGLLLAGYIFALISEILRITAGMMGLAYAEAPERAKICVALGITTITFVVFGHVFNALAGATFVLTSLISGTVLTLLYIYSVLYNKRIYEEKQEQE